jgi:hypothetical protein
MFEIIINKFLAQRFNIFQLLVPIFSGGEPPEGAGDSNSQD